ncbi:MAG TPA: AmmeMemoRadiSam system radical SAM enzyme [Leucothrix mucor]|uniref:AmmeMemoRadiSam system radical SAM enzyme n=1 Tax=Leucothrix mucor TaxID=45248 RepID=A0A7V2SZ74_LEUMU|nr:AmmeMemoRadiSam system radical SAM enzyme [Leucothrix mucor]
MRPIPPLSRPAQHWIPFNDHRAECCLCPRHCRPKNGRMGFCGVRGTVKGEIRSFNYGQSLAATEEIIETEAVNHFSPSARILSMGNVGCMMACSFCQNWETSQIQHLDYKMVRHYTPEQLVEMCLENDIPIISWTYNDPVVWHEFVVETSLLAQKNGIKTLYKSAFYIEEAPVKELLECIDIFSLSLKSLNAEFYQKQTKAKLQPVLDRIKQVADSGAYLELSQLVIPELNDQDEDIEQTIDWVIENIGVDVPLHFVAFHPAYQYTHVERTDIATLKHARKLALAKGMKHIYLGNTYEPDLNDTACQSCGTVLVKRYGLHATVQNLDNNAGCIQCGTPSPLIEPFTTKSSHSQEKKLAKQLQIHWTDEVQSAHILQTKSGGQTDTLLIHSLNDDYAVTKTLSHGLDRFIVSRRSDKETGIIISWDSDCDYQHLEVLDRAHYPVTFL